MEFKKHGKICSNWKNSGLTSILTDRDRRALKRIMEIKKRTAAAKLTVELNQHLKVQFRPNCSP